MFRIALVFALVVIVFLGPSICAAQRATSPTSKDDAEKALSKVLLIGDSISCGYRDMLKEALLEKD